MLGDLNAELILTYSALKADVESVLSHFHDLPKGSDGYYAVRAIDPTTLADSQLAARFLYLNRYCFNGLYRTNLRGEFNVPYGPPRKPLVLFEERLRAASKALETARLFAGDFEETLKIVQPGDFVYLDPPYMTRRRRVFREYLPKSFGPDDLERLARALSRIDLLGATFLVSYADSPEARRLLKPWFFRRVWTHRHIAGFADARRGAYELLASNRTLEVASDGN